MSIRKKKHETKFLDEPSASIRRPQGLKAIVMNIFVEKETVPFESNEV